MSNKNPTHREVYLFTRTINETGSRVRKTFKVARDLTGHNFSIWMHWGVIVDDSILELGGDTRTESHIFVKRALADEDQREFQHKELMGYTSMTDEEILSAGIRVTSKFPTYNILSENCRVVVEELLQEIIDDDGSMVIRKPSSLKERYEERLDSWPTPGGILGKGVIDKFGSRLREFMGSSLSV